MSPEDAIETLRQLPCFVEFSFRNEVDPRADAVFHIMSGQIVTATEVNTAGRGLLDKAHLEPALEVSSFGHGGGAAIYLKGEAIGKYVAAMIGAQSLMGKV